MRQNVDYELVPAAMDNNEFWQIRLLKGDFVETVIEYGALKLKDNGLMTFDYNIISSPDSSLNEENKGLQEVVKDVLLSLMEEIVTNDQRSSD